mmetsp:Transcript_84806/g.154614  ORF Transcript_84806/g.154614 Transcript_84806/m.154614 type:complete len:82 (+) Transcript_84806:928-1173(+)
MWHPTFGQGIVRKPMLDVQHEHARWRQKLLVQFLNCNPTTVVTPSLPHFNRKVRRQHVREFATIFTTLRESEREITKAFTC